MIKSFIRSLFPGVSWQNPVINTVFKMLDPFDSIARSTKGLSKLPPYSIRVRSAGVQNQFGGGEFVSVGDKIAQMLKDNLDLTPSSIVLEIGCGSGRTAFSLGEYLEKGNFYGMDIEEVALNSCIKNRYLQSKEFKFELMDVQNDEFNPNGQFSGDQFKFPYDSDKFDVIFLVSVFTHMMTSDVQNYVAEISRLLVPGAKCMITTFLIDLKSETDIKQFPFKFDTAYCREKEIPEIAVGYELSFYESEFAKHNMTLSAPVQYGHWRENNMQAEKSSGILQDMIVFSKNQ